MITKERCNVIIDKHEVALEGARRGIDKVDTGLNRTDSLEALYGILLDAMFHADYIRAMIDVREKSANVKA